jgi:RNA polymerase sigma factor (sigma-70 family)
MNTKPDEYYINETLNGNVNAYAFLVERYKHMVFTLTIRIVKNREEAEEVSQDVFVKAYKNLKSFKGESKFSTWIYKIGYYASLDVVKKNKRQINSINIDEFNEGNIGSMQDGLKYLEAKERKKVINDALLRLNEDEQVILTLYYFEEMPLKEISKVVNLSLENIKVKLFRARKKLFSLLKNVIEPRTINLI